MGIINLLGPPVLFFAYRMHTCSVARDAAKSNPTDIALPKKRTIDFNDTPQEVCEVAAEMGIPVGHLEKVYLKRPSICDKLKNLYDDCVKHHPGDALKCAGFLNARDSLFSCSEFEKMYAEKLSKYY